MKVEPTDSYGSSSHILSHDRRRIVHLNVTEHPTAAWTRQPIREAFPDQTAPAFLIRDRDGAYGSDFGRLLKSFGIEEVVIAPRSPWQNPQLSAPPTNRVFDPWNRVSVFLPDAFKAPHGRRQSFWEGHHQIGPRFRGVDSHCPALAEFSHRTAAIRPRSAGWFEHARRRSRQMIIGT